MLAGVGMLAATGTAWAAPATWCKDVRVDPGALHALESKDPGDLIKALVSAECNPTREIEAHRDELEQARASWSRRLGMTEADWSDAVAYATTPVYAIRAGMLARSLAAASPLDQYAVILNASEPTADMDALYAADLFEPNLSEAGRFAFLERSCVRAAPVDAYGMTGTEVIWAICQPDIDRMDVAKLLAEIHSDTTHDGALRMKLRIDAYELSAALKRHLAEVEQMKARDDASKRLFTLASQAREAWSASAGKNTRLLELVLAMDSAALTQSRKQLEGCEESTAAALAEAVAAIPASSFAGMYDDRGHPDAGFATVAGPVLATSPAVLLAAGAALRCAPKADLAAYLHDIVDLGAPSRGPRNAALARIKSTRIRYDNANARLVYPQPRPYGGHYLSEIFQARSLGGVVKSVQKHGDTLKVEIKQTFIRTLDCTRSHKTGRISKINADGRVEYEDVCDRSELRTHSDTWNAFELSARYAAWLKPGVMFSATGKDVIAVWPSATAKTPSIVLGGQVH
ncbi:MAG TPA: hypothetical protein VF516_30080 [Kofleriaceae bacterium]